LAIAPFAAPEREDKRMNTQPGPRPTESCLLIPVPEAEQAVGGLRGRLDRAAAWGVPAHVTILFPFVVPGAMTADVVGAAAAAVASVRAFDCVFARTRWFGQDVLWLAPEPDDPFRALTSAAHAAFPQYPPFGGRYPDVVPHLTIGDRPPGGPAELAAAEAHVKPALPVRTHVSRAWLMTGAQAAGSWRVAAELPLGG
jgi:2'-5' RNA ligase